MIAASRKPGEATALEEGLNEKVAFPGRSFGWNKKTVALVGGFALVLEFGAGGWIPPS